MEYVQCSLLLQLPPSLSINGCCNRTVNCKWRCINDNHSSAGGHGGAATIQHQHHQQLFPIHRETWQTSTSISAGTATEERCSLTGGHHHHFLQRKRRQKLWKPRLLLLDLAASGCVWLKVHMVGIEDIWIHLSRSSDCRFVLSPCPPLIVFLALIFYRETVFVLS